ncbi:regulatory protein RecX [Microbacterium sp. NPDC056234]|uniref:regulatory protein RecX n=1 Tax=Microbacterium sp. NPDC056234 TaxID=3345757 RepID=UPI0035D726A4
MTGENGGEESLAPVIPLFGRTAPTTGPRRSADAVADPGAAASFPGAATSAAGRSGDDGAWHPTWATAGDDAGVGTPSVNHPAYGAEARATPKLRALRPHEDAGSEGEVLDPDGIREKAEELLVRKLRARSLSISEARTVLRGYELQGQRVDAAQIDDVIDDFCRRGYLDDAILAGHLVTSGVERKGQGRVALSRALAQRGIPRDVIDAALDELPDDDAERALEFARTKARSLSRLDNDTALRRLVGQLARRGYNGAVAMNAAKAALAESGSGASGGGVRFVDSD